METCSGVYVWFNQEKLYAYLASELFKVTYGDKATYEVHDVLSGTECSIENHAWAHTPPMREDVEKAYMLIVHLKIKTDVTPEPALRQFMEADGGGYTKRFDAANGPKGLRGKYFTYKSDTAICSGFYTFLKQKLMLKYMASDPFKQQGHAANVAGVTWSVHEVCPGTERCVDMGSWIGVRTKPGPQDMINAKLLYTKRPMNWKGHPKMKSPSDLKKALGEGGGTAAWADYDALRHKYFIYCQETETYSGVYVWFNRVKLNAYLASDLFQATYGKDATWSVHDVLSGTECSIENYAWAHTPPTREDVEKGYMLIVHLKVNVDVTPEPALRELMAADGGGYTKAFNKANGPAGLRGAYFTCKWFPDR